MVWGTRWYVGAKPCNLEAQAICGVGVLHLAVGVGGDCPVQYHGRVIRPVDA